MNYYEIIQHIINRDMVKIEEALIYSSNLPLVRPYKLNLTSKDLPLLTLFKKASNCVQFFNSLLSDENTRKTIFNHAALIDFFYNESPDNTLFNFAHFDLNIKSYKAIAKVFELNLINLSTSARQDQLKNNLPILSESWLFYILKHKVFPLTHLDLEEIYFFNAINYSQKTIEFLYQNTPILKTYDFTTYLEKIRYYNNAYAIQNEYAAFLMKMNHKQDIFKRHQLTSDSLNNFLIVLEKLKEPLVQPFQDLVIYLKSHQPKLMDYLLTSEFYNNSTDTKKIYKSILLKIKLDEQMNINENQSKKSKI